MYCLSEEGERKEMIMTSEGKRSGGKTSYLKRYANADTGKRMRGKAMRSKARRTIAVSLMLGCVTLLVLGFVLIYFLGHSGPTTAASGPGTTSSIPVGFGSLNHPKGWCGEAGQPACPNVGPGWFVVPSESPADVAAAIASSQNYLSMQSHFDYVALDTPVLVHAYGAHTGKDYYDDDHWVVSVRNAAGQRCGLFDFVYDRANQRARFSSYGVITPQDPHSRQAFPSMPATVAVAQLWTQRHLHIMAGTEPELIFFPIDPSFPYLNSPVHSWAGGGNSAMLPMWHLVGSDGHDYFVGIDLQVYMQKDLPIAKGQP